MPRPAKWSGPTVAIRVPKRLAPVLMAIAKLMDKEDPTLWDEDTPVLPQALQKLWDWSTYVQVKFLACDRKIAAGGDRLTILEDLLNALRWSEQHFAADAKCGLFRRRWGEGPVLLKGKADCPLLAGIAVGDRVAMRSQDFKSDILGTVVLNDDAQGNTYVAIAWDDPKLSDSVFNSALASKGWRRWGTDKNPEPLVRKVAA
jgi:hypothetical protein